MSERSHAEKDLDRELEEQACIDRVAARASGLSLEQLRTAMADELMGAGYPPKSPTWLDAVVRETASGNRYVMGTHTTRPADPAG